MLGCGGLLVAIHAVKPLILYRWHWRPAYPIIHSPLWFRNTPPKPALWVVAWKALSVFKVIVPMSGGFHLTYTGILMCLWIGGLVKKKCSAVSWMIDLEEGIILVLSKQHLFLVFYRCHMAKGMSCVRGRLREWKLPLWLTSVWSYWWLGVSWDETVWIIGVSFKFSQQNFAWPHLKNMWAVVSSSSWQMEHIFYWVMPDLWRYSLVGSLLWLVSQRKCFILGSVFKCQIQPWWLTLWGILVMAL